ncbi:MAG: DUF6036 family nucleotidyltransferase [Acidimicrobiales bacterium]
MLNRTQIEAALHELVSELHARGQRASIYLVGGTALMLGYDARQATRDVDAVATPRDIVLRVAAEVAERLGLPDDWFSTNAAIFVPPHPEDPSPTLFFEEGDVRVEIASAEMLLAMKIRASRGRQDISDIRLLLAVTDTRTVQAAIELYERVYEEDEIRPRALTILRDLLPS